MQRYALIFLATIRNCGDAYAWDNWWITSTSFGRYYPVNGAAGGENVGAGVIPALTPQKIKNIWHGCGMITVTGVRAGINPALRWMMSLPMEKSISRDSSEVDFCCVSFLFFLLFACIR